MMTFPVRMIGVMLLALIPAVAGAHQATRDNGPAHDLVPVVIWAEDSPGVVVIDANSGETAYFPATNNLIVAAITTDRGGMVVAEFEANENETKLRGIRFSDESPVDLGSFPGRWSLPAIEGQVALLMRVENGLPIAGELTKLPVEWSVGPANANSVRIAWVGPDPESRTLIYAAFDKRGQFRVHRTDIELSPYPSAHVLKGTTMAIVVDFFVQTIREIDLETGKVARSASFGTEQFKRPSCASTLSPDETTLYLLANKNNGGDGIIAVDVKSFTEINRFRQHDAATNCLRIAPSGDRLVLIQRDGTIIVDTATGAEIAKVESDTPGCCAYPDTRFLP